MARPPSYSDSQDEARANAASQNDLNQTREETAGPTGTSSTPDIIIDNTRDDNLGNTTDDDIDNTTDDSLDNTADDISASPTSNDTENPDTPTDSMAAATGDLINLGEEIANDCDVYEPVWDQTSVTRNQQDVYSVPRPVRGVRPQENGAAIGAVGVTNGDTSPPPLLPPKNSRSNRPVLSPPNTQPLPPLLPPPAVPQRSPNRSPHHQLPQPPRSPRLHPQHNLSPISIDSPPGYTAQATSPSRGAEAPFVNLHSPFPTSPGMGGDPAFLTPKMREALGMEGSDNNPSVQGWNSPPPTTMDAPPPYVPRGALERGANKSLKFSQVEQLEKEMKNTGGIKVMLRRSDCYLTMALVDCFGRVW